MALKKRKPFVLHDKEAARKEYAFSKLLTLSLVFSAFIVPFINDGVFSLLHSLYISGDYTLKAADIILSYLLPLITVCASYFSYAAVVLSLYYYGTKNSFGRIACLMGGVLFLYLISYLRTCIANRYILFDVSDEGSFVSLVAAVIMCIFIFSKNVVLLLYTHFAIKKMRKGENAVWLAPCEGEGKWALLKRSFSKKGINARISLHFFSVSLICDIAVRSVSTYMEIASAGAPEEFSHYLYFAEQYALVFLNNLLGLALMIVAGGVLGKYVSEKEKNAYPYNPK